MFRFFGQYYPELFLARNITVMRKQSGPLMFTYPSFPLILSVLSPTATQNIADQQNVVPLLS